jgi:hypothetical protein
MSDRATFLLDCLDEVCGFATPAVQAVLARLNKYTYAQASAHLYARLKAVHVQATDLWEQCQDENDKELPVTRLAGVAGKYGQYIKALTYYARDEVWENGLRRQIAQDASYLLAEALPMAPNLEEFRWLAPYAPDLPVFWTKLPQCPMLQSVHLDLREIRMTRLEPDPFGVEVISDSSFALILTSTVVQVLLAFRNMTEIHLTGREGTSSWTFGAF